MNLTEIAVQNLLRRKAKAAFVMAGLVIGVATVVGVIGFSRTMERDINHKLEKYGANILVTPRTENLSLTYGGLSLGGVSFDLTEIRQQEVEQIHSIKNSGNIAAVGPIVLGVVEVRDRKLLLAGIDFESIRILKPWWQITGAVPAPGEVILGSSASRVLSVPVGGELTVDTRPLRVSGQLTETGSQDDDLVFTDVATAQALLGKQGRISMVEVAALCKDCPIEEMVRQITNALPSARVMAIQQVVQGRMEALAQFRAFSYGISAVVILVGSLVVLVTTMGSVRERTREIGIFRAIGFRRRHILRIIFTETAIVSGIAGIAGYGAGILATLAACRLLFPERAVQMHWDPTLAVGAFAIAMFMGLIASAYPARMASRMDPNEALRAL